MDVLAHEYDVQLHHPLFSPRFVSVFAKAAGVRGYAGRTEVMRTLFADVLPEEINSRPTKAVFGQPHWTHYSQDFGRSWNGEGVNPELVDVDVLHRLWTDTNPPPGPTLILLKQAWLASNGLGQRFESSSTSRPAASAS
jgi:asparagine synthase (glutamine-hydrolysing)